MQTNRLFKRFVTRRVLSSVLFGGMAIVLPLDGAQAVALLCQASDSSQGRFSTVYVITSQGGRELKQFDADLEVERGKYKERQPVKFLVDGVEVATRRLKLDKNRDLEADLKLSTDKKKGYNTWPANFPTVKHGTKIVTQIRGMSVLSCSFP